MRDQEDLSVRTPDPLPANSARAENSEPIAAQKRMISQHETLDILSIHNGVCDMNILSVCSVKKRQANTKIIFRWLCCANRILSASDNFWHV